MQNDFQHIGRFLIFIGIMIIIAGGIILLLGKVGGFRMPGNINLEGKNWKIFFPIGTCILLSILLTLISWLIHFFSKK